MRATINKSEIEKILKRELKGLESISWEFDDSNKLRVVGKFDMTCLESIELHNMKVFKSRCSHQGYVINPVDKPEKNIFYVVLQ